MPPRTKSPPRPAFVDDDASPEPGSAAVRSEDDLIARYFAPIAGEGADGLRDDAAVLSPRPGHDLVLTKDMLVAGVHFFPDDPPASIAVKALAVNLSDLAAKGAEPAGFLLGLGLPENWREDWVAEFAAGLGAMAARHGCPLLGGDTVKSPERLTLSITAFGHVPAGGIVRRTAARPGDVLFVSGTIGDGALGLIAHRPPAPGWANELPEEHRAHLVGRYLEPRPRLALVPALRAHAHAAMDVSDGLVGDLAKMMRVSDCSATVDLDAVPLSPAARAAVMADPSLLDVAVTGGDDYEILASVPEAKAGAYAAACASAGVPAVRIGRVEAGQGTRFLRAGAEVVFARGSWGHF